jgi:hypothetical protein
MGAPVSLALAPRTRPSVPSYLTHQKSSRFHTLEDRSYHGNASYDGLAQVLGDLKHELLAIVVDVKSIQNFRQVLAIELD